MQRPILAGLLVAAAIAVAAGFAVYQTPGTPPLADLTGSIAKPAADIAKPAADNYTPVPGYAQAESLSPRCSTPVVVCIVDPPLPVGSPCKCGDLDGNIIP